jgi:hypothetical protein
MKPNILQLKRRMQQMENKVGQMMLMDLPNQLAGSDEEGYTPPNDLVAAHLGLQCSFDRLADASVGGGDEYPRAVAKYEEELRAYQAVLKRHGLELGHNTGII